MSEKKKRHSNLWALNLSNPEDPLLKCLNVEAEASNLVRPDGSVNKSRLLEDLVSEALLQRFQKRGYMEGLGLLSEHARRRAVKEAIATGKPLPAATIAPQSTSPQPSAPTQTGEPVTTPDQTAPVSAQPQTAPTPKQPEKKRRVEGSYVISSSGHMKREAEKHE